MKPLPFSPPCAFLATLLGLAALSSSAFSQDITPPVVNVAPVDLTVPAGTTVSVVKLKKTFALQGVTGTIVRFATTLGDIDMELDGTDYPLNVANFLGYVNSGDYNGSFIHRAIAQFIFQGGGYHVVGDRLFGEIISKPPTVAGEHKGSNVRGTIAMALISGTNSANTGTDQWFFNLIDNTQLDTYQQNQGPFTAFGRVIEGGLAVMDAIGSVETYNLSGVVTTNDPNGSGVFNAVPLHNYQSSQGEEIDPDLVTINDVAVIPLVSPASDSSDSAIKVKAKNSNHDLLTATVAGKKLKLIYNAGKTGVAHIKVIGIDSAGTRAVAKFTVTVQ